MEPNYHEIVSLPQPASRRRPRHRPRRHRPRRAVTATAPAPAPAVTADHRALETQRMQHNVTVTTGRDAD